MVTLFLAERWIMLHNGRKIAATVHREVRS